jgi:hypothetical protein
MQPRVCFGWQGSFVDASPLIPDSISIIAAVTMSDRASEALAESFLPGEPRTYDAISKRRNILLSTLYHRAQGRRSKDQKAESQQYLTVSEEIP